MEVSSGIIECAQKVVIYGPEGIGKSSLAAMFPGSFFIDVEGSTKRLNVRRSKPAPSSWSMLSGQIINVKNNPGLCDTLIVDTADWAEILCKSHICATYNKTGIEDFGYGKGYVYLEEEFGKLLNSLTDLVEMGINVVLTAHAQTKKFELPDEMGAFDKWEMKLEKKTAPLLKEWADMVLFVSYKTFVVSTGSDGKGSKKAQGGRRVIYTQHHPCWDAKNRHNLPEELPFGSPEEGWNGIKHCFPVRTNKPAVKSDPVEMAQSLDEAGPKKETGYKPPKENSYTGDRCSVCDELQYDTPSGVTCKNGHGGAPAKEKPEPPKQTESNQLSGVPKPLADLMIADSVTVEEIQKVVFAKGHFPIDTPIANYGNEYIGRLISGWSAVFKAVCENRR